MLTTNAKAATQRPQFECKVLQRKRRSLYCRSSCSECGHWEGKSGRGRGSAFVLQRLVAVERLAAHVTESKRLFADGRRAGEFARGCERRGKRGWQGRQAEAAERAVDLAARADAFDDLLAEIAALAEVKGV